MDNIEKALKELQRALESNETVARVTVTITMVKPKKSDRAESKPKPKG